MTYFKKLQNIENVLKKLENVQNDLSDSGVMSSNLSERLEKLRWTVMIVKLGKGQKVKNFENNCKFY